MTDQMYEEGLQDTEQIGVTAGERPVIGLHHSALAQLQKEDDIGREDQDQAKEKRRDPGKGSRTFS